MEHQNSGGRRVDHSASSERKRSTPKKKKKSGGGRAKTVLKVLGTLCLVGVLTIAIFTGIFLTYVKTVLAPDLQVNLDDFTMDETSIVYYQDTDTGTWKELEYLYGDENRIWLDYDEIPEYAINAAIAIEDQRFKTHHGVDWKRTGGAVIYMFFGMKNTFGGSTITQQVVKNVTGDNQNTVKRKITEIFRALELEKNYTKEQIMETYLNKITFGGQVYGLGAAAKTYFNKEAKDLTLAQCASIIAITNNPSIYDPLFKNEVSRYITNADGEEELVTKDTVGWNKYRQEIILYEMLDQGLITQEEYDQAMAEELVFYGTPEYEALYGTTEADADETDEAASESSNGDQYWSWFVEQVFTEVKSDLMEEYGYNEETAVDLIYSAGYRIYATVDPEIQDIAESVYEDVSNLDVQSAKGQQLQSGITIMDPYTGEIKAIVGKIGEKTGNRVQSFAATTRPCGSAIKPLSIYAPALDSGAITLANIYDDYPVSLNERQTSGYPRNSPNRYAGLVTVTTAIRQSKNTATVRILREMGASVSYDFMVNKLGFTTLVQSDMDEGPMAMGGLTYGVNTMEMAAAFSAFANRGIYNRPKTYTQVTQVQDGVEVTILDNNKKEDTWVAMQETTAYLMNEQLKGVVSSGTGTEARISGMTVAGKTGTTSNLYDRYFVGYTPYYCAAVWVGYPEFNEVISYNKGNPAADLWQMVMSQVHEGLENKDFFERPEGLTTIRTCTTSGLLAGDSCTSTQSVLVVSGTGPTETCTMHQTVEICTESGMLASEFCPPDCRETRTVSTYQREIVYLGSTITVDPETGEEIVTGTPIEAPDDDQLLVTLEAAGTCNIHTDASTGWDPNNPFFPGDGDTPTYDPTNPDQPITDPDSGDGESTDSPTEPTEPTEPDDSGTTGGLDDWLNGLLGG